MAITAFDSTELALVTNDKPVLIGTNAVESAAVTGWVRSGNIAGTDYDLDSHPIKRAYDRYGHLPTKPDAGNSLYYLAFDLGADVLPWDTIVILGHNFGTLTLNECKVETGTGSTFSSTTTIHEFISTGTMSSDKRLVAFLPNRYSTTDARYVRLNLQKSGVCHS